MTESLSEAYERLFKENCKLRGYVNTSRGFCQTIIEAKDEDNLKLLKEIAEMYLKETGG